MVPRVIALVIIFTVSGVIRSAFAQSEPLSPPAADGASFAVPIADSLAPLAPVRFADGQQTAPLVRDARSGVSWTTPVLASLHATTMVAQMLDVHSTLQALDRGAVETNPVMGGLVKNKAAFVGVKAAMGAGLVLATHKMSKRNRIGAIVMSAAINGVYLYVAHHNYKVARSLR
jgi:hypothetical protein